MNDMPIFMPLTLFSPPSCRPLDQVGDVHRHFLDLSRVELLDITHHSNILCGNKVDGDTKIKSVLSLHFCCWGGTLYDQNVLHVQFCGYSFHDLQASRS